MREQREKRVFSEEHRRKLSLAHKGQVSSRKGKKFVDEAVAKANKLAYRRAWRVRNQPRLLEAERNWRERNRERANEVARNCYQRNRQKILDRIRASKYGITGEEFRAIMDKQEGRCPICGRDITTKNLSVDHDHSTERIRGVICNSCNLAIGNADDSPARLRAMAAYLERNA